MGINERLEGWGVDRRWAEMCFRVGKRRGEEEFSEQAKQAVVQNHPAPFTANCKYRLSLVLMTDQP